MMTSEASQSTTNGMAALGATSPLWYWPILEHTSNIAVMLVPIVSLIWLVLQIAAFIIKKLKEFS